MTGLREKIDYGELELEVIDQIGDIADRIEAFTIERGYDFVGREMVFDLITEALKEIHIETFLKNKQRKLEIWSRRQVKKIKKFFKF